MHKKLEEYIQDQSQKIDWYLGSILIGSEATWYSNDKSDIDIHVFVDQTQQRSSKWDIIDNRIISIIIYPLNDIIKRIEYMAKIWSYRCKRMYGQQWVILDDPYWIMLNLKQTANETKVQNWYNEQDLRFTIWWLQEFERLLESLDIYSTDKLLFHIFEQHSFFIWFDHYNEFTTSFWKIANRIFIDDQYAWNHRWKIYPDKEFINLRIAAYKSKEKSDIYNLLNHSREKLKKLL